MPEIDLNTPEGRAAARAEGLPVPPEEGEVQENRNGNGTGIWGPRSTKRTRRDDVTPEQAAFLAACQAHGLPEPVPEYRFCPGRKWRFDWLFEGEVVLEIEGGAFRGPGHRSVGVFLRNIEKYNEAALLGYTVLRCTTDDIKSGAAFALVKRALGGDTHAGKGDGGSEKPAAPAGVRGGAEGVH